MISYASSLFSTLFRLSVFVFLRIIPTSLAKFVLPTLFSLYISTLYLSHNESDASKTDAGNSKRRGFHSLASPLVTVILTSPTSSRRLRLLSLFVNSILLLASIEFAIEDYLYDAPDVVFTRLGAIYPDKAKLAIRYPNHKDPIHVVWREVRESSDLQTQPWILGPPVMLSGAGDWVNSTTISPLWPDTVYEYSLATPDKQLLSYPSVPIRFKTFPDPRLPRPTPLRFIVSSCMKPNFPYIPFKGNRIKGMDLLADYLWPSDSTGAVVSPMPPTVSLYDRDESFVGSPDRMTPLIPADFMLFLGDFVYADVPYYFGDNLEAYRRLYRRNYESPSFRRVYERLPIFFTYDDHEFVNNYAGSSRDRGPYLNGSRAFFEYNAQTNFDSLDENQFYYEFSYGKEAAFFVLDTRRHRSTLEIDPANRTMLGAQQLGTFLRWLSKVRPRPDNGSNHCTHCLGEFHLDVQVCYYVRSVCLFVDA